MAAAFSPSCAGSPKPLRFVSSAVLMGTWRTQPASNASAGSRALIVEALVSAVRAPPRAHSERDCTAAGGRRSSSLMALLAMAVAVSCTAASLEEVQQRAHFAWREAGGRFSATHTTYRLEAAASGTVSLGTAGSARWEWGPLELDGAPPSRRSGHVSPDGSLALDSAFAVHRLTNGPNGVHQTVELPRAAGRDGALDLSFSVSGLRFVGRTASGLHFAEPGSSAGFCYGPAQWTSADGRTASVRVAYRGGRIHLEVPAAALRRARYPAVIDPLVSPELGVDQPLTAPTTTATGVSLASGPGMSLAVWQDSRAGDPAVFAARITTAGAVLDPTGILLATRVQTAPSVA